MRIRYSAIILLLPFSFSCVSTKKFKASEARYAELDSTYRSLKEDLNNCKSNVSNYQYRVNADSNNIDALNKQIAFLKENNNQAVKQLQDLSVISSSQAESIKKSLDNISGKDAYIQNLQAELAHKDSLNMALVMNLKGAIGNMDDKDINIKVDKGVIYIDISDKLLFK